MNKEALELLSNAEKFAGLDEKNNSGCVVEIENKTLTITTSNTHAFFRASCDIDLQGSIEFWVDVCDLSRLVDFLKKDGDVYIKYVDNKVSLKRGESKIMIGSCDRALIARQQLDVNAVHRR